MTLWATVFQPGAQWSPAGPRELISGYLDDVSVGGRVNEVSTEVLGFETKKAAIGLRINYAKCEVVGRVAQRGYL